MRRGSPTFPPTGWRQFRAVAADPRTARTAIVALARKLLAALWRYLTQGVVPEGAVFKAA